MCGRYTLRHPERLPSPAEVLDEVDQGALMRPRYNIAPSQHVLIVQPDSERRRQTAVAMWGFRPRWLPDDRKAPINARAETVADKPMFRGAFHKHRCLVPADGWYEWQVQERGPKLPHFFHRADDEMFWFAGLTATDAGGRPTTAILTTNANAVAQPIHGRMPVVLMDEAGADTWLNPDAPESALQDLLCPAADGTIDVYPVSRTVNKPENDDPGVIEHA